MRWSTILGFLAGTLVVVGAVVVFLGSLAARPPTAAPSPVAIGATSSPSPGPSVTPSPAPTPSTRPSTSAVASGPSARPSATVIPTQFPTPGESPPEIGLKIGDLAPPLALDGLGGDEGRIDTTLLRGKPVWVNFMASYCPPCRDELPLMERIQAAHPDDFSILLVDVQEEEPVIEDFVTSLGVTLPVGLDRDGQAAEDWRALALPIHFWLDGDGRIRGVVYGGAPPDVLLDGLRTVVPTASFEP